MINKMANKRTTKYIPVVEVEERHDGMILIPQKKDWTVLYLLFGILLMIDLTFLIGYGITAYIATRPIEFGGNVECNSGDIGIDYQSAATNFSYYDPLSKSNVTGTHLIDKVLNLKGIKNVDCKLSFNSKGQISDIVLFAKAMEYIK